MITTVPTKKTRSFIFEEALTSQGWFKAVRIEVDSLGKIASIALNSPIYEHDKLIKGASVPGIPNAHSHSFQRAIAGRTATRIRGSKDHFWTWRTAMYETALKLTPEDILTIAEQCFLELMQCGYTSVAEFHYLHRDQQGLHYQNRAELSEAVIQAALNVGLPITHLPVLYRWSGVGSQPLSTQQRRFELNLEEYAKLIESLDQTYAHEARVQVGIAPHSLRAVSPEELNIITQANFCPRADQSRRPIHIHIAEQMAEVNAWKESSKQAPVEWLLDHHSVDAQWCLVHATHLSQTEIAKLAKTNAIVGLCPSTEADLGDGLFPLEQFLNLGGRFALGSDSNLRSSPAEELRILEWGQRLFHQRRNLAFSQQVNSETSQTGIDSLGQSLSLAAIEGGAQAVGRKIGFNVGAWADWFTLNPDDMGLSSAQSHQWSDQWLFSQRNPNVKELYIAGQQIIREGRHPLEQNINQRFTKTMKKLFQSC